MNKLSNSCKIGVKIGKKFLKAANSGAIITQKKILRRRTAWTVVIIEVDVHMMDTGLDFISGVCNCAF